MIMRFSTVLLLFDFILIVSSLLIVFNEKDIIEVSFSKGILLMAIVHIFPYMAKIITKVIKNDF